jgi:hypothetical protein
MTMILKFVLTILKLLPSALWILGKAPPIIAVVTAMIDLLGSAQVQALLEAIREAIKKEVATQGTLPKTEEERVGFFKRIFQRWALGHLGISEREYANMQIPKPTHSNPQPEVRSYV